LFSLPIEIGALSQNIVARGQAYNEFVNYVRHKNAGKMNAVGDLETSKVFLSYCRLFLIKQSINENKFHIIQ
jgi:hypothetical protein